MPSFFAFQQGSDTRSLPPPDTDSLRYGRFRAFSPARKTSVGNLFSVFAGELGSNQWGLTSTAGYGSINIATGHEGEEDGEEEEPDERFWLDRILISPRRRIVLKLVGSWYARWGVLMCPAVIVSLGGSLLLDVLVLTTTAGR
jgi:hypothetical protein